MEYNYAAKVRKQYIPKLILWIVLTIICILIFIMDILYPEKYLIFWDEFTRLNNVKKNEFSYIVSFSLSMTTLLRVVYITLVMFNPCFSEKLRKYGTVKELESMVTEINNTVEYIDYDIVITKNYIIDQAWPERIMRCSDVVELKKEKLFETQNMLRIKGANNMEFQYTYPPENENRTEEIIGLLRSKSSNIKE